MSVLPGRGSLAHPLRQGCGRPAPRRRGISWTAPYLRYTIPDCRLPPIAWESVPLRLLETSHDSRKKELPAASLGAAAFHQAEIVHPVLHRDPDRSHGAEPVRRVLRERRHRLFHDLAPGRRVAAGAAEG